MIRGVLDGSIQIIPYKYPTLRISANIPTPMQTNQLSFACMLKSILSRQSHKVIKIHNSENPKVNKVIRLHGTHRIAVN